MERTNKKDQHFEGHDEVDRAESYQRGLSRRVAKQTFGDPNVTGLEFLESPGLDDSAYHTFPHTYSHSSIASSDRFPSEESFRSSSPLSQSSSGKRTHSTLVRIQLGDDKKISHEWYSEFTKKQTPHNQAFSSPLANRAANSSSQFEYDSHIAHMRGKYLDTNFFMIFAMAMLKIKAL